MITRKLHSTFSVFFMDKMCTVRVNKTKAQLQGWEFAHRFSERIARFLQKNERMSDSLKKIVIHSFARFW